MRSTRRRPVRWWPAGLILVFAGFTIFYFRVIREDSQQWRNIHSMQTCVVAVVLLLIWALLWSRMRWQVRLLAFGSVIGFIGLMMGMFRIHGVTGDLVPVLKFRWSRPGLPQGSSAGGRTTETSSSSLSIISAMLTNSYPQFLGPDRNATVPEGPRLARNWSSQPPQKLWRQPVGPAWSGFAIAGNRAITLEQRGDEECVVCYELLTGKVLWTHSDKARYFTTIAGEGPRTTPSLVGDKVVTLGGTGILNCLELASGKVTWSKDIISENQSHVPEWGVAGSPLVLGDRVIVNPGGTQGRSLVAYRLSNGEFAWGGGDDNASYSSPCGATLGGVPQILIFDNHAIFGHDAASGRVLWQHPWDSKQPHVAVPVALDGDRVLASSGYGVGSELLQVTRDPTGTFTVNRLWKTNRLKAKFNNLVTRNGYVYGLDDGILACLDLATGELKWKDGRYGHGQFILVRDLLFIIAENGELALLDPVPTERRELTKFQALNGKTWNPPALVGEFLLVRNDQEAACYRLPLAR
jgi:outer membrane protein assembly factor BamB